MKPNIVFMALAALVFTTAAPTAKAQKSWTLKECIQYGLQHNPQMAIAKNQKGIAHEQKRQALSGYYPQLNASASLDDNLKRQVSILPAGLFGNPKPTEIQFGTKYTSMLNAQLSQTVFDYAIIVALDANKYNKKMAEMSYEQAREQLVYSIAQAYYQVMLSQEQIKILSNNRDLYSRLLPIMQLQADKGVLAKIEVDKIRVSLNNMEARVANVQNIKEQALNVLKFQMGLYDNNESLLLADTLAPNYFVPEALDPKPFDYKTHTNYKLQQTVITLNEYDARRIRAGGLPRLSIVGNYGAQALNDNFGDLYKNLYDFSAIGLRLSIPIFDGFGRNALWKQKKYEIASLKERLTLAEAQQKLQYDNARTQMTNNRLNLETNKRNIALAQKVFNTTNLQYEKGVAPLSELLQAEQSLRDAQNTFMSAMVNYYQAILDMENANNTIMEYYGANAY